MSALVVGGTSGLGYEIARNLSHETDVHITGRRPKESSFANWMPLELSISDSMSRSIGKVVSQILPIDTLVYAAGFYQEGRITDLYDYEVESMLDVGVRGLIFAAKNILEQQGSLDELITITSTSQWTPREKEPVYNAAKAAAGHFSNALSLDERVGKVLVAAPAGMKTDFWSGVSRDDLDEMMDPAWVAEQIDNLRHGEYNELTLLNTIKGKLKPDYSYCFAKILRANGGIPDHVEIVETR